MTEQVKLGLLGCRGRMGRAITEAIVAGFTVRLVAAAEHPDHPEQAMTLSDGVIVTDDPASVFAVSDAVIDFTPPGLTARMAPLAARSGAAYVVGTTGLGADDHAALDKAAEQVAVVQAGNFSLGVNLLQVLTRQVAATLGEDWDIDILEMHHRHKVDAPSGTAKMLGEAAADGRGRRLADVARTSREGTTGPRPEGEIGFATLRGGAVIGEHEVIFASENERLTLSHKAENRGLFAAGAVRAARWAATQAPGRYAMTDVLGL
ncbi:4-hydroxy-tetrahydrodipicolinate reductase [Yunchengibacter salinarum]|uniref:4-hydroxy-tetrahydrodipicolinate reductase n=1 Tax=Yunchengibacter salinarum TaxID=3133399 RepID=UPI0035B65DE3